MDANTYFPIIVCPYFEEKENFVFLRHDHKVEITTSNKEILHGILKRCSGLQSITSIAIEMEVSVDIVAKIIRTLIENEVVLDSREQYLHFHRISNYPTYFQRNLSRKEIAGLRYSPRKPVKKGEVAPFKTIPSALEGMISKRQSCRSFQNISVGKDVIGSLCHYGYDISRHTVPSGGALYPLKIYVIVTNTQADLSTGYYEYDAEQNSLICFNSNIDVIQLKHCFNMENLGWGAPIQIIIAADLDRSGYKYSNRGYRLTLLEAGHVAENIVLFCAEYGLGSCELGGLLDDALHTELELDDGVWPLLGIAIGYPDNEQLIEFDELAIVEQYSHLLDVEKVEYGAVSFDDKCSFFGGYARYGKQREQIAGATSASFSHAVFKAFVEACERKACSRHRVDMIASELELNKKGIAHISLNTLVPLTPQQRKNLAIHDINSNTKIEWTRGHIYNNGKVCYLPTDYVFYGHKNAEACIYYSNSSGVAAHTNIKKARKNALLEIIERDAIMQCWFSHVSPPILGDELLSVHIRKKKKIWASQDRAVYIMELPSEYANTFLAIIVSNNYPCFVCGASATESSSKVDIEEACEKALEEAEYCLYSCLQNPKPDSISVEQICTPGDHGRFYHLPQNCEHLTWLWSGEIVTRFNNIKNNSFEELCSILGVIETAISENEGNLSIVRLTSPKLVPISFGINNLHYSHVAIKHICKDSLVYPHFFA